MIPSGRILSLVPLLAATDLVFLAGRPSSNQGIGPMSQSKTRESPSRKKHRRIRKAQQRLAKVAVEATAAAAAAQPVPAPEVVNPHAAAIDVHSDNHVVCIGPNQVQT